MSNSLFKTVAVLGLGPAGAYAARAAVDAGALVDVYAPAGKNNGAPGAFWLYSLPTSVPLITSATPIHIFSDGSEKIYREKQWGALAYKVNGSSFPRTEKVMRGYEPTKVLPALLPREAVVHPLNAPLQDSEVIELCKAYDHVFQTFPSQYSLKQQPPTVSYLIGRSPIAAPREENYVLYCGTKDTVVVRISQLWGNRYLEFPKELRLETLLANYPMYAEHTFTEVKDLHPDTLTWTSPLRNLHYIGRWATWDKRWLSHMAYEYVQQILSTKGVEQ